MTNSQIDLKKITAALNGMLDSVSREIALMLRSDVPVINDSAMHLFSRGGKKVRACLVMLSSALKGADPESAVKLAAATEIVHAATLIHDDIIDKSQLRRGDITVSERWGSKVAVLVGDFMYTTGLKAIVDDGNPDLFSVIVNGTRDMVQGELYQLQYSNIDSISMEHYYNIIELKTARFMAACAKLGGVKSNFSSAESEALYNFGIKAGMAFQIVDDTLDLAENAEETGKDAGTDFRDGKVTMPFLYMLENGSPDDVMFLKAFAAEQSEESWNRFRDMLKSSGAVEYSIRIADKYVEDAFALLDIFPDSEYKRILLELTGFFVKRGY